MVYTGAAGGSAFTASWEEGMRYGEGIPVVDPVEREQLAGILSAQDWIRPAESYKR